jgi:uncharacterized protein (TIGR00255 family)
MITSMTGYGKAVAEFPGKKITIEIRSLNSKQPDITIKFPPVFREWENEVRNWLSSKLERGKIDIYAIQEFQGDTAGFRINRAMAGYYFKELKELSAELDDHPTESFLPLVLKMPEVVQSGREETGKEEWNLVMEAITSAAEQVVGFRKNEGRILEQDILSRVSQILDLLSAIEPLEGVRMAAVKERLQKALGKLMENGNGSVRPDPNRFEQELIYYLEKLDITEEKVRLKKHCDYFLETVAEQESQGKKLGFIVQEMGREINTIGSKANDAEIQKLVVQMKDELEKIREQLLNIL